MKQLILAAAIFVAAVTTASAQSRTPMIHNRQQRQEVRIQQGRHSGQLTRAEAYRLQQQHARIRRDVRMARADGHVSARERAVIRQRQAVASRSIYRQKHDFQYRR